MRVVVWYREQDGRMAGLQFFDAENEILLGVVGHGFDQNAQAEWILRDGERILGFRSRAFSQSCSASHCDF